jgi:hypothetical protein
MRAEEGNESIKDYADEARQTQGKVTGGSRSLPQKLREFFGVGRPHGGGQQDGHR